MTKDEIRAELRRSACEDDYPFHGLMWGALRRVLSMLTSEERLYRMHGSEDIRTLFLLVAEALES